MFFLFKITTYLTVKCPCGFVQGIDEYALNSIISLWEKQNNNVLFSGDNVRKNNSNFSIRLSGCFCCAKDRLNMMVIIEKISS